MKIERILLTTDFSKCAAVAYGPAVDLARKFGSRIDLVHCTDSVAQYSPDSPLWDPRVLEAIRRGKEGPLRREAALDAFRGIHLAPHLLEGVPAEAIADFARRRGTDLIVQSSHGRSGWRRFVLGSFAERVIRVCEPPVLTVKSLGAAGEAGAGFDPRRIVFPYDFSEEARAALGPVRFLAKAFGAPVLVLHVARSVGDLLSLTGAGTAEFDEDLLGVLKDFPERLRKDLGRFAEDVLQGLDHSEEVAIGDPAERILERIQAPSDLVCIATHGWSGIKRAWLGSVAEKVARLAVCPVLSVRAGASAPS